MVQVSGVSASFSHFSRAEATNDELADITDALGCTRLIVAVNPLCACITAAPPIDDTALPVALDVELIIAETVRVA